MGFLTKIFEYASYGAIVYIGWLLFDFYINNRKRHGNFKIFNRKGGKK